MNEKYYISENLYLTGMDIEKSWEFIVSYIKNIGDIISVVNWLPMKEFEIDKSIFNTNFNNETPQRIYITKSPFIEKTNDMYLCKDYKLSDNIYNIISNDWYNELKEENICPNFVIKYKEISYFMLTYNAIIARLSPVDFNVFNNLGFELKEWNIELNKTL